MLKKKSKSKVMRLACAACKQRIQESRGSVDVITSSKQNPFQVHSSRPPNPLLKTLMSNELGPVAESKD